MLPEWKIWLDNQFSSALAKKMQDEWKMNVKSAFILKNKNLDDKEIYLNAQEKGHVIIITKDADFPSLVTQYGCPPKIIKLNTGNMPTNLLWDKYKDNFKSAIKLLQKTKAEIIFIE